MELTREEAKDIIEISKGEVYPYYIEDNVDEVIDKIYDSLEQRITELEVQLADANSYFDGIRTELWANKIKES